MTNLLQKPVSLANGVQALEDYITIVRTEYDKRSGQGTMDPLLAAQEFRKRKREGKQEL